MPSTPKRNDPVRTSAALSSRVTKAAARTSGKGGLATATPSSTQVRLARADIAEVAALSKTLAVSSPTDGGSTPTGLMVAAADPAMRSEAAEELARRLKRPLQRVDLGALASRYIGETEKNLAAVFAEAKAKGAILLFDEADAVLGRRTDVKDAHDRYANLEPAFRQQAAAHPGILIFGTQTTPRIAGRAGAKFAIEKLPSLPDFIFSPPIWRRDLRLVRMLLLAAERTRPVEIPAEATAAYPRTLIHAHLVLLIEAGLLHGMVVRSGDGTVHATAERLTWAGHDAVAVLARADAWVKAEASVLDGAGRAAFAPLLEHLRTA